MIQILELFGGIGSPRCALRNLNIPTKAIDYGSFETVNIFQRQGQEQHHPCCIGVHEQFHKGLQDGTRRLQRNIHRIHHNK